MACSLETIGTVGNATRRLRTRLGALLLAVFCPALSATEAKLSKAEIIKQFTSSPPIIEEIVFRLTEDYSNRTNTVYYACALQPNALYSRRAASLEKLKLGILEQKRTPGAGHYEVMGHYEDICWNADDRKITLWNRKDVDVGGTPGFLENFKDLYLSVAFNLGVVNVTIGGLQWDDGYSFSAIARTTSTEDPVEGLLRTNEVGDVEMRYTRTQEGRVGKRLVTYDFDDSEAIEWPVPHRITHYWIGPDGLVLSEEIEILSIKTNRHLLP